MASSEIEDALAKARILASARPEPQTLSSRVVISNLPESLEKLEDLERFERLRVVSFVKGKRAAEQRGKPATPGWAVVQFPNSSRALEFCAAFDAVIVSHADEEGSIPVERRVQCDLALSLPRVSAPRPRPTSDALADSADFKRFVASLDDEEPAAEESVADPELSEAKMQQRPSLVDAINSDARKNPRKYAAPGNGLSGKKKKKKSKKKKKNDAERSKKGAAATTINPKGKKTKKNKKKSKAKV